MNHQLKIRQLAINIKNSPATKFIGECGVSLGFLLVTWLLIIAVALIGGGLALWVMFSVSYVLGTATALATSLLMIFIFAWRD